MKFLSLGNLKENLEYLWVLKSDGIIVIICKNKSASKLKGQLSYNVIQLSEEKLIEKT